LNGRSDTTRDAGDHHFRTLGEEKAVECLKIGATDYLLKQHLERLVPALNRALHEAEARRSARRWNTWCSGSRRCAQPGAHDFALAAAKMGVWEIRVRDQSLDLVRDDVTTVRSPRRPGAEDHRGFFLQLIHPDIRSRPRGSGETARTPGSGTNAMEFRTIWPDDTVH